MEKGAALGFILVMKGIIKTPVLFFAIVFFLLPDAGALKASETGFVSQLCKQLASFSLPSDTEGFIKLLTENFDIDYFSNRVMKDISPLLNADDKKELTQLLLKKLQNKTREKIATWDAKNLSDLVVTQKGENQVLVRLKNGNKNVNLDIHLSFDSAKPRIGDLAMDGALFSRSLRSQFTRIFNEEGTEGLKKRLQNSVQKSGEK